MWTGVKYSGISYTQRAGEATDLAPLTWWLITLSFMISAIFLKDPKFP